MAKSKKKTPKGKKAYKQGYVSFTPEDLEILAKEDPVNGIAYGYLDQAMITSSHVSESDVRSGSVDIDDTYPVTLEETLEMEALLDKAQSSAGNPNDPFFTDRLGELRGIVAWSKKRHWNFSWIVIIGVIVSVIILFNIKGKREEIAIRSQACVDKVEAWSEMDTTITLESMKDQLSNTQMIYDNRCENANKYKLFLLDEKAGRSYFGCIKTADEFRAMADTASTAKSKKDFLKYAKQHDESAEEYKKEFDRYNKMDYKEIRKEALDYERTTLKRYKSRVRKVGFWAFFFLICIPLYIFADRPYGYMESRHRTEAKVLGGIKKWGFALSGILAGSALATEFLPDKVVKTSWSDGSSSTHTEADYANFGVFAIKLVLYAAAIIVICIVSCFIMVYSTITGLTRNYNWRPFIDKAKSMANKKAA